MKRYSLSHRISAFGYARSVRCIKISTDVEKEDFHSLIEKLNNGDKSAFDEIYKRCAAPISFLCRKFCYSKEDAEEVVQDTFIIAFKKAADLQADTLMAYLRKIATNECFRKRKKNSKRQEHIEYSDTLAEDQREVDESLLPEEALQNKELQEELLQIIHDLPKNRREMIYLYYYADLSAEEIANLYNCTKSTVYVTLNAARKTIKSKLEGANKKHFIKGVVLVPLTALLLAEEQVFAASYIGTASTTTWGADIAGKAEGAANSIKVYVIAACAVAACAISVAVYFALSPSMEADDPTYEMYTELPASETETPTLVTEEVEEPAEMGIVLYAPHEQGYEAYDSRPLPIVEEPYEAQPAEESTYAPSIVEESTIQEEPLYEPQAVDEPTVEGEPYEPEPIPEPELIDRTLEILAALAVANAAADVTRIINYYGFEFAAQIHFDMQYRFYVLDDGSGDILIGIATNADGTSSEGSGWHMRFQHFEDAQMPTDILARLRFMEQ